MRDCIRGKASFLGLLAALPLTVLAATEVYVPLGSANAVAAVDAKSDRIVAEIPGINASQGLAVSMDGELMLAGSLLERPRGTTPPKPQAMSEEDHAPATAQGNQPGSEKATNGETLGTAYLIDAMAWRLLRQFDVLGAVHYALVTPDGRSAVLNHPAHRGVSVGRVP